MAAPGISIIVPVHNGSKYLKETLESLLSQTFTDFELLAIDDGSTDDSADIVRSLKDDRIRLIQKSNAGLCSALNLGIAEAAAPMIARSDQDDVSFPERLSRQMQVVADYPDAICLFAYSTKIGAKHGWSNADKVVVAPGQVKEFEPMKDGCLLGSTMLARTAALRAVGGYRPAYYPSDDWDLELRLSQAGRVLVLREPVIAYRFHTSANTYGTFADMQLKTRWAKNSYQRRLQHESELSIEEFGGLQSRAIFARLNRYRKDSSKLHMRVAGQRYLDGSYLAGASHLAMSALLNPGEILRRTRRYFVHR